MAKLSEWLDVMLGEISRKEGEAAVSAAEQKRRDAGRTADDPAGSTPAPSQSPSQPSAERR
jgi:hypothetical protein